MNCVRTIVCTRAYIQRTHTQIFHRDITSGISRRRLPTRTMKHQPMREKGDANVSPSTVSSSR